MYVCIYVCVHACVRVCVCECVDRSGLVVECLTRDPRAAGSSLTGNTALCPRAKPINPCLVLVQPRKICPSHITKKLLTGT